MKLARGVAAVLSATACTVIAADRPVTYGSPVIVTATRFEETYLDRPVNATVINAEDIRRSTARTVPELLSEQAGILMRDLFGNNADSATIDLRGFGVTGQQNTLILVDGRRFGDIDLSGIQWSAVPLAAIERIEIVRGSGSVLYGDGATAGVINIITKSPARTGATATVQGRVGSYDTYEAQLYASLAHGNLGFSFIGSDYHSDGYRDNNRNRQSNAQGEVRWTAGANDVSLKLANDNQGIRLPGVRAVQPSIGLNQLESDRRGASTPLDWAQRVGNRATLDWTYAAPIGQFSLGGGYRDKEQTSYFDFGGFPTFRNAELDVWSLSPRMKFAQPLFGMPNSLIVGVDWYRWDYRQLISNSPANIGRPAHVIDAAQDNTAFYLHNTTQLTPKLTLVAGARNEHYRIEASDVLDAGAPGGAFDSAAAPGSRSDSEGAYELALRYAFTPQWSATGRMGRSYRFANVDELYEFGGPPFFLREFQFLRPQTARSYEASVDWQSVAGSARATLFQIDVEDEIHLDVFLTGAGNTNLPPLRRRGLELDGQHAIGRAVRVGASYTYLDAEFREGAVGGIVVAGKTVPLVPRHKLNVKATWDITAKTRLNALATYVSDQFMDNDETNTWYTKIPSYTLLDLKLTHQEGGWRFSAGVNNLLGEKYYTYAIRSLATDRYNTYPLPERNFTLTAEYAFR
jgi:iron complex outermembrane receptor protein